MCQVKLVKLSFTFGFSVEIGIIDFRLIVFNSTIKNEALNKLLSDSKAVKKLFSLVPSTELFEEHKDAEESILPDLADRLTKQTKDNRALFAQKLALMDRVKELRERNEYLEAGGANKQLVRRFEKASEDLFLKHCEVDEEFDKAFEAAEVEFKNALREIERNYSDALKKAAEDRKRKLSELYEEYLIGFSELKELSPEENLATPVTHSEAEASRTHRNNNRKNDGNPSFFLCH